MTRVLCGARARAAEKGIAFTMMLADLLPLPTNCPVYPWIKLVYGNSGRMAQESASIDRIDPKLGYIAGNVRVISWKANRQKGDATAQERAALAEDTVRLTARCGLRSV